MKSANSLAVGFVRLQTTHILCLHMVLDVFSLCSSHFSLQPLNKDFIRVTCLAYPPYFCHSGPHPTRPQPIRGFLQQYGLFSSSSFHLCLHNLILAALKVTFSSYHNITCSYFLLPSPPLVFFSALSTKQKMGPGAVSGCLYIYIFCYLSL